jgi:hypothetical protein
MQNPPKAAALNTLGTWAFEKAATNPALIDSAIRYFARAIEYDASDAGLKLNLAIAYLVKADTAQTDSLFQLAYAQSSEDYESLYALLSLDYEKSKYERGTPLSVTEEELKSRIAQATSDGKKKRVSRPAGSNPNQSGGSGNRQAGGKKTRTPRPAGPKKYKPEDVKVFLYIKMN